MPLHLRVGAPLRVGVSLSERRQGRRRGRPIRPVGAPTAARRPRAGTKEQAHAHGGQTRDGRRAARGARQRRTLIVSEYRGLKVKEIAEIRRALRKQDVTLSRRQEPPDADRRRATRSARPSARCSSARPRSRSATTRPATAKAVLDATRPYNQVVRITGGVLGDQAIDADDVTRLAALPSREVLLAKLAGGMQAPVAHAGRPVRRAAAQPGLRPAAGRRPEGRSRGRRRLDPLRPPTHPTPTPHKEITTWQP